MDVASLVEASSAAAGAAVVVAESSRRYWRRREVRQQAAFRLAVRVVVDEALRPVIKRQADVLKRLDNQDVAIAEVRRAIERKG